MFQLTGFGSYTHCLNPDDAVFRSDRPFVWQLSVTFCLNGTRGLSGSARETESPSSLLSGRDTQTATKKFLKNYCDDKGV